MPLPSPPPLFSRTRLSRTALSALLATALLAGCASVGPDYRAPTHAELIQGGKVQENWLPRLPHESAGSLEHWWTSFGDPVMVELIVAAQSHHPDLEKAAAAILSARAGQAQSFAKGLPGVDLAASGKRSKSLNTSAPSSTSSAGLFDAGWEVDLFGSVRRAQESASARLESAQASFSHARVSLAAEVASEVVKFRACTALADTQARHLDSLKQTAHVTRIAVDAGLMAHTDLSLANAGVSSASASLTAQKAECTLSLKALVALTGLDEPALQEKLNRPQESIELNVTSVPADLIAQRPDLAALERNLAAASAEVGVAESNRYPRLSLMGTISLNATQTNAGTTSVSSWSFGPSLSLPIFDGGTRQAQVERAQADYASALAQYRAGAIKAIQEVEQALVRLNATRERENDLASSAKDYRAHYESMKTNWEAGNINLLLLEQASRNALQAEQAALTAQRDRHLHGIALYKALGGGWETQ